MENYENSNLNTEELREKIELREKVEKFLNRLLETNEPILAKQKVEIFLSIVSIIIQLKFIVKM